MSQLCHICSSPAEDVLDLAKLGTTPYMRAHLCDTHTANLLSWLQDERAYASVAHGDERRARVIQHPATLLREE